MKSNLKKYIVQFYRKPEESGWEGSWKFEALSDSRAWEITEKFINDHTSNQQYVKIRIESIHELDDSGNLVRRIPSHEDCVKHNHRKEITP